jgi:peptide/nickel transport system ATP-binding protein
VPRLDAPRGQALTPIRGSVADAIPWSDGCAFAPRCDNKIDLCTSGTTAPLEQDFETGRLLRCYNPVERPAVVEEVSP